MQPWNAEVPMLVTLFGITMLVKLVQPWNAEFFMLVTLPSVGITLFLQPNSNVLLAVSIKQLPALWYFVFPLATVMLVNPVQPKNAESPIVVTLDGSSMLVKPAQSWNANSPILVTLDGIVMLVKPVQQ